MVEHEFYQIRDCRREVHVALQPCVNQSNRVVVQAANAVVMRYSVEDRGFYRRAKQVLLAFEVIVDERRIDSQFARNVFDGDGCKTTLGKKPERRVGDFSPAIISLQFRVGRTGRSPPLFAQLLPLQQDE